MAGPLPDPAARRRNAPTIPTTKLPAGGRTDPAPRVPSWVTFGKPGRAFWSWAWKTPQAAGWAAGHEPFVARRASIEDDLAALEWVGGLDVADLLDVEPSEASRNVEAAIRRLHGLAAGRLALLKEARELDDRLGLNPKGMAALRWTVVGDAPKADRSGQRGEATIRRLRAVDPTAAAG